MGTKRFSNPRALSSALAALETLQPRAFGLLNRLVPLVLASNYYIFKEQFPNTTVILDATEIKVNIPTSLLLQSQTYGTQIKYCNKFPFQIFSFTIASIIFSFPN